MYFGEVLSLCYAQGQPAPTGFLCLSSALLTQGLPSLTPESLWPEALVPFWSVWSQELQSCRDGPFLQMTAVSSYPGQLLLDSLVMFP